MKVGDVVRLHNFDHRPEVGQSFTFKAPTGYRFVAVILGVEHRSGSAPLDTTRALQSLGWTPPPQAEEPPEEHDEKP